MKLSWLRILVAMPCLYIAVKYGAPMYRYRDDRWVGQVQFAVGATFLILAVLAVSYPQKP